MMCHCLESSRFLLTAPYEEREDLRLRSVSADIASLKWTRQPYIEKLKEMTHGAIDYAALPAEDYARATVSYESKDGSVAIAESTSLFCYTGRALSRDSSVFQRLLGSFEGFHRTSCCLGYSNPDSCAWSRPGLIRQRALRLSSCSRGRRINMQQDVCSHYSHP